MHLFSRLRRVLRQLLTIKNVHRDTSTSCLDALDRAMPAWQNRHSIVSVQLAPTTSQYGFWRSMSWVSEFKYLVTRHSNSLTWRRTLRWATEPVKYILECIREINVLQTISIYDITRCINIDASLAAIILYLNGVCCQLCEAMNYIQRFR